MALNIDEKHVAAALARKNPEAEYMIKLSGDEVFAREEIATKKDALKEELLKEKEIHESHIQVLQTRLEKISLLLSSIGVIENAST